MYRIAVRRSRKPFGGVVNDIPDDERFCTHKTSNSQPCQKTKKAESYNSLVFGTRHGLGTAVAADDNSIAV